VFQFSGLRGTIAIPIKTFMNLPTDLRLSFPETLMNFQIQKYFPPILSFCWDASVLDVITEATVKLPNSVNLSLLSAWQLRGIFADNFEIQILWRSDGKFFKVAQSDPPTVPAELFASTSDPPPSPA